MSNESNTRTIGIAVGLSVLCAVALAVAVTLLKPIQQVNRALDTQRKILAAAGVLPEGTGSADEVRKRFSAFERYLVDLDSGDFHPLALDDRFDLRKATRDPQQSDALGAAEDIASLRRRAKQADVYVLRDAAGRIDRLVLPVSGYGLWSTMHGYLVLQGDGSTVSGITFTEHGETPGLGGEIDNPRWQASWVGKRIYGEDGRPALTLSKNIDASRPEAAYQVDAISGATLTGNGVTHMIGFWLGDLGFRKFLDKIREEA